MNLPNIFKRSQALIHKHATPIVHITPDGAMLKDVSKTINIKLLAKNKTLRWSELGGYSFKCPVLSQTASDNNAPISFPTELTYLYEGNEYTVLVYSFDHRIDAIEFGTLLHDQVWRYVQCSTTFDTTPLRTSSATGRNSDYGQEKNKPSRSKSFKFTMFAALMLIIAVGTGITANYLLQQKTSGTLDLSKLTTEEIAAIDMSPMATAKLQSTFNAAIAEGQAAGQAAAEKIQKDQFAAMKSLGLDPGASAANAMSCLSQ